VTDVRNPSREFRYTLITIKLATVFMRLKRKGLIDPNTGIGGAVINSAPAKAAQYHALLSSLAFTGVPTDQESRSRHRLPAPFEFVAQDAGAASEGEAVDELDQHRVDDVDVFGEVENVTPQPLPAAIDPVVNVMTEPHKGVLELYEEFLRLESIPCSSLAKFSCEEKVHIELLPLLKDLMVPLSAFQCILNLAAKANGSGHVFQVHCQPSRETVTKMLFDRYDMNVLVPKEQKLYLPNSKRIVNMVYFDARQVFASLLLCRSLNKDECFIFNEMGGLCCARCEGISYW
jgi:hypothetical protein